MSATLEAIRAGRANAQHQAPYLSTALYSMKLVEKPGFGTWGVSQDWICYYDPSTIEKWNPKQIGSVWIHEVWHLLRNHHSRCQSIHAHPEAWNMAADLEVNGDSKLPDLPEGALRPRTLSLPPDLLAEEYYDRLPKRPAGGQPGPQNGQSWGGSCSDGVTRPWESPPKAGQGIGEFQAKAIGQQVAKEIKRAAERSQGNVPADILDWANAILAPAQINWLKELSSDIRRIVGQARGRVDWTWRRPSRRSHGGIILPGLYQPLPDAAIIRDTSGSMGVEQLGEAIAQTNRLLKQLGTPVLVIDCDCQPHIRGRKRGKTDGSLMGGGGTDMQAAVDLADRHGVSIIITVTDGYTSWANAPRAKHITLLVGKGNPAPYGKVIEVNRE